MFSVLHFLFLQNYYNEFVGSTLSAAIQIPFCTRDTQSLFLCLVPVTVPGIEPKASHVLGKRRSLSTVCCSFQVKLWNHVVISTPSFRLCSVALTSLPFVC